MRKALGVVIVGLLGLSLHVAAEQIPEKVTLDGCGDKQAPVTFGHAAHAKRTECKTCHHAQSDLTEANAASMDVKSCTECHVQPSGAALGCSDMSMTKNAYHVNCVTCHKEAVKADATKKAPTKCAECHVKG